PRISVRPTLTFWNVAPGASKTCFSSPYLRGMARGSRLATNQETPKTASVISRSQGLLVSQERPRALPLFCTDPSPWCRLGCAEKEAAPPSLSDQDSVNSTAVAASGQRI